MASYGVVKVFEDRLRHTYPDMPWEPKAAFTALADYYEAKYTYLTFNFSINEEV